MYIVVRYLRVLAGCVVALIMAAVFTVAMIWAVDATGLLRFIPVVVIGFAVAWLVASAIQYEAAKRSAKLQ